MKAKLIRIRKEVEDLGEDTSFIDALIPRVDKARIKETEQVMDRYRKQYVDTVDTIKKAKDKEKSERETASSDLSTMAAGFSDRFTGLGNIKLDAGFDSKQKGDASENTAIQQLVTLTQIRELLESANNLQPSALPM